MDFRTDRGESAYAIVRESGSPVCSHVGPSSMYDTRQLGLPSRYGQGIGLVRKTGVIKWV